MKMQGLEWVVYQSKFWIKGFQNDGIYQIMAYLGSIILGIALRQLLTFWFTHIWLKLQKKRKTTSSENPKQVKKQD